MSRPWPLVCASLSFLRSRFCLPPFLFLDKDDRPFPPKVQWPLFTLRLIHLIIVILYEMKSLVFTALCSYTGLGAPFVPQDGRLTALLHT